MSVQDFDFVRRDTRQSREGNEQDLSLCYAYPTIKDDKLENDILTKDHKNPRELGKDNTLIEDGLYSTDNPVTYNVIKPYQLNNIRMLTYKPQQSFCGKLLEIAVRAVNIHPIRDQTDPTIEVSSVSVLFKKKIVCKANSPFNRKLHKLLIRNSECNNLSIQVQTNSGQSSVLPLPLPKRNVKNTKIDIDFAVSDNSGRIHAGTVTCTVSMSNCGTSERQERTDYMYKLSNDPNDPQNSLSLLRPQKSIRKREVKYFTLVDPALTFHVDSEITVPKSIQAGESKLPDLVVTEQPAFSILDISFRNFFQARRPLKPSSSTRRHHAIGRMVLSVTVLRGVEVPVREESALVQPFVEIEWGSTSCTTNVADGPAPVWQQTMNLELPRQNEECCVKIRLYDQHPVWGPQWLGEARVPLERHRNYQELERWIAMSPLFSPVLLFGYVQASPGQSHTRVYVLMKMEQPGNSKSVEKGTINALLKGVHRCLATPYKINGLENPQDAARLAMLLPSLPIHYGPVTPRQALNVKKVDHYGRAALLATLLEDFDLQSYVLLGSSQITRWSAFVISVDERNTVLLWDPEVGSSYRLYDSRSPLLKVSRLINHLGIWENLQKSVLPHNLKYDVKSSKDWRPLEPFVSSSNRIIQTLDLSITEEEERQVRQTATEMEHHLKNALSHWRSTNGLTTIFNRHAMTVLRNFISKIEASSTHRLDKRDVKQLYRAYHTHGFVLNTRESSLDEMAEQLKATKTHNITGPVEFALICHVHPFVGKISSIWLAIMILRSRD